MLAAANEHLVGPVSSVPRWAISSTTLPARIMEAAGRGAPVLGVEQDLASARVSGRARAPANLRAGLKRLPGISSAKW